jgi:hypothetical protein
LPKVAHMIFKDCLNMLTFCALAFHYQERKHVQILEHVEQELQSFFEFFVPSAIRLRFLFY